MDEYLEFTREFFDFTGIDLQSYKRPQMERRLTALRNQLGFSTFKEYMARVRKDPQLLHQTLDKMTINVSEFLRNPERWEALIPHLKTLSAHGPLHAWSAACSTGEEPYSLALVMEEYVRQPYSILATDIDENVLAQAQAGVYRPYQMRSVSESLRRRYFDEVDDTWRVRPRLRAQVTFRKHNLLADAYPTGMSLIICRNVLIYFTDEAKQRVVERFAHALRPGGLLFVGSTEQFLKGYTERLVNVGPFLYQRQS
ncbi:chemotaxis protein methyltransferase [Alicyclobacillus contaminans]|uniref:CheR family methyltransferase n=1 Tax=Alicyclobacillus contaminans TaxID=392016 RepID=UPI0004055AC0|nr:protein-glutamate O-methyltransferase CheR [Alicyclobacillus contaminans]GMA52534.1 chemotaxis protein methyltransferase [Alicyclobacillus contaminans]